MNYSGSYAAPRLDLGEAYMEFLADMDALVGLQILPIFRSPKRAANFSALSREALLADSKAGRASRSHYNRIDSIAKDKTFFCKEYGLEQLVDDSERALYASDFDAEAAATKLVAYQLQQQQEERVAAAVFNTTTFTGASLYVDNSASPWATISTDVITQVESAIEKVRLNTGMMPNSIIIPRARLANLFSNTQIAGRFPRTMGPITAQMIADALAEIFGITKMIVPKAVKNSANEGQAFTGADIWDPHYVMVARLAEDGDALETPCLGRSFLWVPDSPNDVTVEMYREEQSRGDVVRARHNVDENVFDKNFGFLMKVA